MANKKSKSYKKLFLAALLLFLLINIVVINQAYHLTHFYEHGTVKPIAEQTKGFFGVVGVSLLGLKQQKLVGTTPDSPWILGIWHETERVCIKNKLPGFGSMGQKRQGGYRS